MEDTQVTLAFPFRLSRRALIPVGIVLFLSLAFPALAQSSLFGVWENRSRFVEFSPNGSLRVVLKPYYGFVYEDTGPIPCSLDEGSKPVARLSVRYSGEKTDRLVPAVTIGDGLYLSFFRRLDAASPVSDGATALNAGSASSTPATSSLDSSLDGFWLAEGNATDLLIYRTQSAQVFYCYLFSGSSYCKIRYWLTDARVKDVLAEFTDSSGAARAVPKFIAIENEPYTCVTSTGKALRNFETGSYTLKDGKLAFKPNAVVFAGTTAAIRESLSFVLSPDGSILALGAPYLTRSKVTDLDAEIKAHNGLRRPPRKPVFGYMDLDFHWDEIERIRNNGKAPVGK